ncbi:hypothetical protein E2C01_076570 [Portunus trituberculatus]|uniref:Uncharacterized protein n=1 Tax=Portunus trituberculatus TaxID=210409 RepID=A0A5B7IJ45_PORTR|nr:hypothetical protein [Portunus trituberculatus]
MALTLAARVEWPHDAPQRSQHHLHPCGGHAPSVTWVYPWCVCVCARQAWRTCLRAVLQSQQRQVPAAVTGGELA